MALPEAIAAIETRARGGTDVRVEGQPDTRALGQRPSVSVYRDGLTINSRGDKVYTVAVEIKRPATRDRVRQEDIDAVYAMAESLLEWLPNARPGELLLYWPDQPTVRFDWSTEASAFVLVNLCDRYPRE